MTRWPIAIALSLLSAPAYATDCTMVDQPWAEASEAIAATSDSNDMATVLPGVAITLTLHPDGEVAYRSLPQGEGEAASFGGMAQVTIPTAGQWRVSIDRPAWVDLVSASGPAQTLRFGPGAACSGVRKAVTFDLTAGRHVLELSGSLDVQMGVLVEQVQAD
jgi:hypothetical protein